MKKKIKEKTLWVIIDPDGEPRVRSNFRTKQDCMESYDASMRMPWDSLAKQGYSCAKFKYFGDTNMKNKAKKIRKESRDSSKKPPRPKVKESKKQYSRKAIIPEKIGE